MKLRTKVLLCAALNLTLLVLGLLVFVPLQFRTGVESILLAPGQTRLRDLGDEIAEALMETPDTGWNALLDRYAQTSGVDLTVSSNEAEIFARSNAGSVEVLPPPVVAEMGSGRRAEVVAELSPEDGHVIRWLKGGGPRPRHENQPEGRFFFVTEGSPKAYWFGIRIPIQGPDWLTPIPGTLLVRTSSVFFTPLLFDWRPWLACLAGLAVITLACWIPFIRGLTRSIGKITGAAEQIAEGRFDIKTGVSRRDEIGHLSDALHRMAAQLNGFVTGQKRFLGDIAHELCAPISRAQMAVGILEERSEPAQKRHVDTVQEEVAHMSALVNELLQFSKAGFETRRATLEPVKIADLVARVTEREGDVQLVAGGELTAMADSEGLFRALSNVVRNALRYAGEHGPVTISARTEGEHVLISVADEGPGLPEEALDRVFTPFYRVDDSRSRESGGVGLGLSIVKSCVEASGGTVTCRNRSPRGLEVTIRLRASA